MTEDGGIPVIAEVLSHLDCHLVRCSLDSISFVVRFLREVFVVVSVVTRKSWREI